MVEIPVRVELASEYRYRSIPAVPDTLVIVISQSGETADSLAALRVARERGAKTLAVVNVIGSTVGGDTGAILVTGINYVNVLGTAEEAATITVNNKPAAFSTPIMNGDQVDVDIQLSEKATAKSKRLPASAAPTVER